MGIKYLAKRDLFMNNDPARLVFKKNKVYEATKINYFGVTFIDEEGDRHRWSFNHLKNEFREWTSIKFGR